MNAPKQLVRPEENTAGRSGIDAPAPITLTSLTGRDTEVGLLRDRWEQAQEGMGQVVLIVGEPGLGKSRLVHTIKQIVTEQERAKMPGAETEAAGRFARLFRRRVALLASLSKHQPLPDFGLLQSLSQSGRR